MIIAVSGDSYSGKSTVCKHIKEHFNCEYFSAGDIYRKLAAEENETIEQFMEDNCQNEELTNKVNDIMVQKMKEANENDRWLVIEGRMVAQLININEIRALGIHLTADIRARAKRCSERNGTSIAESVNMILGREISEETMGANPESRVRPVTLEIDTSNIDEHMVNAYIDQFLGYE